MTPLSIADCGLRIRNPGRVGVGALSGIALREARKGVGQFQSAIHIPQSAIESVVGPPATSVYATVWIADPGSKVLEVRIRALTANHGAATVRER